MASAWMVGFPRRVSLWSMMSSWMSMPVWKISYATPAGSQLALVPAAIISPSFISAPRMRLPPAFCVYSLSTASATKGVPRVFSRSSPK
jgi:hypothetical protein